MLGAFLTYSESVKCNPGTIACYSYLIQERQEEMGGAVPRSSVDFRKWSGACDLTLLFFVLMEVKVYFKLLKAGTPKQCDGSDMVASTASYRATLISN